MSPSGNVTSPVPTVRATVKAEGSNLSKSDIRLYLDGAEQRRFYYGRGTGNLSYRPTGMLSTGAHTVEIVATGDQAQHGQEELDLHCIPIRIREVESTRSCLRSQSAKANQSTFRSTLAPGKTIKT